MPRTVPILLLLLLPLGVHTRAAEAGTLGTYDFDPHGRVRAVRILDMNGDGRPDLVLLLENAQTGAHEILIARTPAKPTPRTFFAAGQITRIPCDGALANAGAVAVGRFGPKGAGRLRFLGPEGVRDVRPDGQMDPVTARHATPTLFARSAGRDLIFWDGVDDLDGDGRDEVWFPLAAGNGPVRIFAGTPEGDRVLSVTANNIGASSSALLLARYAYIPNLFPADLDGDGHKELVALEGEDLVAWGRGARGQGARETPTRPDTSTVERPLQPTYRLHLPFLEADSQRPATQMRVPRIQLEDVDGDGTTDLLVTLLTGEHGRLESLRTSLFHYPGPFRDPATGTLRKPRARIDTRSCALHPVFVDVDRDGDLDYIGDSMRGTKADLLARVLGKEPEITFVGFRFDARTGTFESAPYFTEERAYSSSETLSNHFGRSAWFAGDFDGDGHGDLLDLGNLEGVEILSGRRKGEVATFTPGLMARVPVKEGLSPGAHLTDLDADGRTDAVLWSDEHIYLIVAKGRR